MAFTLQGFESIVDFQCTRDKLCVGRYSIDLYICSVIVTVISHNAQPGKNQLDLKYNMFGIVNGNIMCHFYLCLL